MAGPQKPLRPAPADRDGGQPPPRAQAPGASRPAASQLRAARERLQADGQAPAELLGPALARSWQRSLDAGLAPDGRGSGGPHASAAQLTRALEQQYELLAHARPVMEDLLPLVRTTGSMLLLADARGTVLASMGDDQLAERAQRVALRPGALWSEPLRGTNAIGTALAEAVPVMVHGAEHYLPRNGFLSCSAAPIHDPSGRLIGAIDITGDHRAYHPQTLAHTLALVRMAARSIEHRLFHTWHSAALRLRFHARAEGIGTWGEGLLAVGGDGVLVGANTVAREALQLSPDAMGRWRMDAALGLALAGLQAWARRPELRPYRWRDGEAHFWRAEAPAAAVQVVVDAVAGAREEPAAASPKPSADGGTGGASAPDPTPAMLQRVLQTSGGNLSEAARRLGISRSTLYRHLRKPGLRRA